MTNSWPGGCPCRRKRSWRRSANAAHGAELWARHCTAAMTVPLSGVNGTGRAAGSTAIKPLPGVVALPRRAPIFYVLARAVAGGPRCYSGAGRDSREAVNGDAAPAR